MHRVRVGDYFRICHEAIGCTYSEKKSIKHKNTKCDDFVSCTVHVRKVHVFVPGRQNILGISNLYIPFDVNEKHEVAISLLGL